MTSEEARREAVQRWIEMAEDALEVAQREKTLGPAAACNRAYFACFYAASAVLLNEGHKFVKHTGVRSALHKHLVRTGRVSQDIGKKYDTLMKARIVADYQAIVRCSVEDAAEAVQTAELVLAELQRLLPPRAF